MAVVVVDPLEMVDVQHQQQRRLSGAGDAIDFPLQNGPEMPPIGQAGERVLQRQLAQTIDQPLQIFGRRVVTGARVCVTVTGNQRMGCIQAKVAKIDEMRGRRVRHRTG